MTNFLFHHVYMELLTKKCGIFTRARVWPAKVGASGFLEQGESLSLSIRASWPLVSHSALFYQPKYWDTDSSPTHSHPCLDIISAALLLKCTPHQDSLKTGSYYSENFHTYSEHHWIMFPKLVAGGVCAGFHFVSYPGGVPTSESIQFKGWLIVRELEFNLTSLWCK